MLEQISQRIQGDNEFHLLLDVVKDSLTRDESLRGTEMKEDIYRLACMREGLQKLLDAIEIWANPTDEMSGE